MQLVSNINVGLTDLRNVVNRSKISENANPSKIAYIVEKILDFDKKQKGRGIKISTPKWMLQRLPIPLAHIKAGSTSENLLIEISQKNIFLSRKRNY